MYQYYTRFADSCLWKFPLGKVNHCFFSLNPPVPHETKNSLQHKTGPAHLRMLCSVPVSSKLRLAPFRMPRFHFSSVPRRAGMIIFMAYVPIPKDLSTIKTKAMRSLAKGQFICFSVAPAAGLPPFFIFKDYIAPSPAVLVMALIMLPPFMLAMYERHGQPFKVILFSWRPAPFGRRSADSLHWDSRLGRHKSRVPQAPFLFSTCHPACQGKKRIP